MMRIYLDVCCLNRPFDDLSQDRVRLESEAVLTVLSRCQSGKWNLIGSEAILLEIRKMPDTERRDKVLFLSSITSSFITVDIHIEKRGMEIEKMGIRSFDAMHIACAEKANADILLTTDDDLLRKIRLNRDRIKVRIENPINWLAEVIHT